METEILPAVGFENTPAPIQPEAGGLAAVAREQSEIQAAVISAKKFPRNEAAAYTKCMKAVERPGLAEDAAYRFPRGGQEVTGPSVRLARELARCWGNIRYGLRVVSLDDDYVHIKGYALDLEANNYVEAEDKFVKKVQRKNRQTGVAEWIAVKDERDLRELINRRGSIVLRNALLQILPSDVTEEALTRAKETVRKDAAGQLKTNRDDTIKKLAFAFDEIGVSAEMLEAKLKHSLTVITADEVTELKEVYKSIRDGHTKRDEHFDFKDNAKADELNRKFKAKEV